MFYMAFFPLFIDPVRHQGVVTFAFMALTVAGLTLLYGLIAVFLTHRLAERMRASPRIANLLERLAGACLVVGVEQAKSHLRVALEPPANRRGDGLARLAAQAQLRLQFDDDTAHGAYFVEAWGDVHADAELLVEA
ncbi:hypothetical protein WR25_18952 [Diploscapter pachys]|uniref:Uncharacterized protein n=1 Tax=Diploscapter pachys TaxID=2018661 RepID=A0A2A2KCX8_9BILA|nr:hypothetical protein WR25_18952 [Diploscapter pachys]